MDVNSAHELKLSGLGDLHDKKITGRLYVDRSELVNALNSYGVTGANEQVESGEPTVIKITETRQRDEKIYDLFKAISADNPKAKQGRIFDMMRVKRADLFTNRRETVRVREISNPRIARIIREQKGW